MISADLREAQADACLAAAEKYHDLLLDMATRLAGSAEKGCELYQEACLRCHEAIQHKGFNEQMGEYRFYLLRTIRNLHYKRYKEARQRRRRLVPLPAALAAPAEEISPEVGPYEQLAEQVAAEARARFSPAERVMLRLHADGFSAQEIADLTGVGGRYQVRHLLDKLKGQLRATFLLAWRSLEQ